MRLVLLFKQIKAAQKDTALQAFPVERGPHRFDALGAAVQALVVLLLLRERHHVLADHAVNEVVTQRLQEQSLFFIFWSQVGESFTRHKEALGMSC
jgi:hypothetical protein